MGNPVLNRPTGKPCRECEHFEGNAWDGRGEHYTACEKIHYFRSDPELGCKLWGEHKTPHAVRSAGRRIIVCGGRDFTDRAAAYAALDKVLARGPIGCLVEGGAPGADTIARQWAISRGVLYEEREARWAELGAKAGPIRNQEMADAGADGLVALPGSRGTADMVRRAEAAGIPVWKPYG
jgi:hypothetical protein